MKTWQHTLFGLLIGLAFSAVILLIIQDPGKQSITLLPASTPEPYLVHVSGEVVRPGVYKVEKNSRVIDAINLAGGFSENANSDSINLADFVQDGSKIVVPLIGNLEAMNSGGVVLAPENNNHSVNMEVIININTATREEIESLPDIGPSKAADIVAFRVKNGKFVKIEDIMNVPGIGKSIFEKIKDLIVVD